MRSAKRKSIAALAATVLAAVGLTTLVAQPASAAWGPFPVMNTSETPPDGVWFRSSPSQNDTNRETGFGVYAGEYMSVDCYSWGDPVGPYNNHIWYRGLDVTRPTVNGHTNYGYMNTHYVNDGMTADNAYPGIPDCSTLTSTPTPTKPSPPSATGAMVYYSPYTGSHLPNTSSSVNPVQTISDVSWKSGSAGCSIAKTQASSPSSVLGTIVTSLGGWSLGRVGTLYELEALNGSTDLSRIKYILLIDPGGYAELKSSCDAAIGTLFATWLRKVPDAHLVVLSGPVTLDYADPVNGKASAGIQNYYFNSIRSQDSGGNLRSRVLVCNYTDPSETISQSHNTIYNNSSQLLGQPQLTTCPSIPHMNYIGWWNP